MRKDFDTNVQEWTIRLQEDPEWHRRVDGWKNELLDHPDLRESVEGIWQRAKRWLLEDIERPVKF